VSGLMAREREAGLSAPATFLSFQKRVATVQRELLSFLETAKSEGKSVLGYGAPAKGNTLLCSCGIDTRLVAFTVDRSPHKQSQLLPGSHLPIRAPEDLIAARPDYVLILPWNLRDEIMGQMATVRDWGGRFVTAIPELRILE